MNVRKGNTPLPPTFASVHIWLTPPPPYSANVICTQPLYILWDGGINYARRRLRPKSESLSGCCVQISVKFLDCRMIPMATFVAELGMMSPAGPLMIATSRQKNLTEYFRIMKNANYKSNLQIIRPYHIIDMGGFSIF